jgi:signal transduction histidine kinase
VRLPGTPARKRAGVTQGADLGSLGIEVVSTPSRTEAIDVVVGLLAELDSATQAGEFYDHVCEAVCRLTSLRRAALLLYDSAHQAVVPVGSHGTDPELVAQIEGTLDETPMAQRALAEDRVVEASDDHASHIPARYARFAGITTITCTPVSAGGRWLGVVFADRGGGRFELTDSEQQTLLTLGRLAALAASVERATRQQERARRLSERISLTREIHEQVIQRLFATMLVLGSDEPLAESDRKRVHAELRAVLADLRGALDRSLAPPEHETKTTLRRLLSRLTVQRPELEVSWPAELELPQDLEPLFQSALAEALRNIDKHARPTRIAVSLAFEDEAFVLEVTNDGVLHAGSEGSGLGLRLISLEALQHGGVVEFGPVRANEWRVRLVTSRPER